MKEQIKLPTDEEITKFGLMLCGDGTDRETLLKRIWFETGAKWMRDNPQTNKETQKKYIKEIIEADEKDGLYDPPNDKIVVGDSVVVMGDLHTKIIEIIGDKYYFLDEEGKRWHSLRDEIEKDNFKNVPFTPDTTNLKNRTK